MVEKHHNNVPFYEVFLKNVTEYDDSGASEYEIYFNYILNKHPDKYKIRRLKWENTNNSLDDIIHYYNDGWDYISTHWYFFVPPKKQ
jgi:hypothetical protein